MASELWVLDQQAQEGWELKTSLSLIYTEDNVLRTLCWEMKRCKTHLAPDGLREHPLSQYHSHLWLPPCPYLMACIHTNYKYNLAIGHSKCPRWHIQVLHVEILRARDKECAAPSSFSIQQGTQLY